MSQTLGSIKGDELTLRCPDCGDSQRNPMKGHLSVNLRKGVFYCVRCGYGGVLSIKQQFDLSARYDVSFQSLPKPEPISAEPEPATSRFSALSRYHYTDDNSDVWDVFTIRDPRFNESVGQYLRLGTQSIIRGESGLGWVGGPLVSTPDSPLRLVEGPYDVLGNQDVCCFGFLRSQALKLLRGHYVLLCPDGDVWQDDMLRDKMLRTVRWCFNDRRAPQIVGLEMIPDGLDPDECHPADRLRLDRAEVLRRIVIRRSFDLERYLA